MTEAEEPKFADLIRAVLRQKDMTQHNLAFHAGVSQTAISLVGKQERRLTESLAEDFARVLGGTPKTWLEANEDYRNGRAKSVDSYLARITGGYTAWQQLGTAAFRLLAADMIRMFWEDRHLADCPIKGFDPNRIGAAHYYARLGYVVRGRITDSEVLTGPLTVEPREVLKVRTLEAFHFPMWLEGDLHPGSEMAGLGLAVEHGPTIDPGYERGQLSVTIKNLTDDKVTVPLAAKFLKIRLTRFAVPAKSLDEVRAEFDLPADTSELVVQEALRETM